MRYDVDYDFDFKEDEFGTSILPEGVTWSDHLCILPNGRYLPAGYYLTPDGESLIYEPKELNPLADLISQHVGK